MIEHKKNFSNTMLEHNYQKKIHKRVRELVAKVHGFKNERKNLTENDITKQIETIQLLINEGLWPAPGGAWCSSGIPVYDGMSECGGYPVFKHFDYKGDDVTAFANLDCQTPYYFVNLENGKFNENVIDLFIQSLEEMQNDEEFYVGTDRYGLYDLTGAGKPDLIPGHAALILHYVGGSPILKDLYYSWVMAEPFFDLDKDALILYYYPLEGVEAPEFWIVLTYDESGECKEELDFNDNVSSTAREQYEAYVGEDRIIRIPTDHLIEEATLETVKDNILSYYDGLGYVPNPADMD